MHHIRNYRIIQKSFQDLLRKQEGDRAMWEYPFAVAGVNITFMLIQMLDLEAGMQLCVVDWLLGFQARDSISCVQDCTVGDL